MRTIAVANQKGGCGKTTTATNLAAALATRGYRVLLVDLDPQGNATLGLGYKPSHLSATIYDVMTRQQEVSLMDILLPTRLEGLHLAPGNVLLAGAELELRPMLGKELVLGAVLEQAQDLYDFCVIDCSPSLNVLSINALVASHDVIAPVQVHYYALEGLQRLLDTIRMLHTRFCPCEVQPLGLLLTFVDDRTVLSRQCQEGMRRMFGDLVFETVIHTAVALAEAPRFQHTILTYAPDSRAAREHLSLADEVLERLALKAQAVSDTVEEPEACSVAV
jgi:chromosome partitioning protein